MKYFSPLLISSLILTTGLPLRSQVKVGDLNANLSGTVSAGYTADFGQSVASDHSFTAAGTGALTGSFYNPNFLSFNVQPFYNESRANSEFQSITASSGVSASASIFGGSNFPGSISYSKVFDNSGNFGVPGVANYTTYGNSDTLTIGWSEHVHNWPTVSVGYQQGSSASTVYGADTDIDTQFHGINADISYMVAGFVLTGGYHFLTDHVVLPNFVNGPSSTTSASESNSYSAGIGHALPFHGSFSASASRSDIDSSYTGGNYRATLDTLYAGVTFNPVDRVHLGSNAQYTDNLLGTLYQSVSTTSGTLATVVPEQASHALDINTYGTVDILHDLTATVDEEHRDQRIEGSSLTADAVTATTTYSKQLWGGFANLTGGFTRTSVSPSAQVRNGFLTFGTYTRHFGLWTVNGSGGYTRDAETLLISYTTNNYNYSGSLSRKFHQTYNWTILGSGSKSVLNEAGASGTFAQTYSTALSTRRLSAAASYSRSNGNALLTSAGLAPAPIVLPVLSPTSVILYGGHAYSASVGTTPIRSLTLSASYSHAISDTQTGGLGSNNKSDQLYGRVQYLVRKIYFQAGFIRLTQSFTGSGAAPVNVNSVYAGISRWFNFF